MAAGGQDFPAGPQFNPLEPGPLEPEEAVSQAQGEGPERLQGRHAGAGAVRLQTLRAHLPALRTGTEQSPGRAVLLPPRGCSTARAESWWAPGVGAGMHGCSGSRGGRVGGGVGKCPDLPGGNQVGWGRWGWNEEEERLEFSGSRLGVWQGMFENCH